MFEKKSVRLLNVPSMQRCYLCRQYRFAIASQALIHQGTGKVHFRWICKSCGRERGLRPTPEYLKNLREMDKDEGDGVAVSLKVLAQA